MCNFLALDIETDTSALTVAEKKAGFTARGLDPRITSITAVAVADERGPQVFMGEERQILTELNRALADSPLSILVTWNGAVFDLPFLQDRARMHSLSLDLELTPDPAIVPKYDPTPGHAGGYQATWGAHSHVDIAYIAKADAEDRGVSWSLKPYATAVLGCAPVEVNREHMHDLTPEQLEEYVSSDAVITWQLARELLH